MESQGFRSLVYAGPNLFEEDPDNAAASQELFWRKPAVRSDGSFLLVDGSRSVSSLSDMGSPKPPSLRGILRKMSNCSTCFTLSRVSFNDKVEYREYQKDQDSSPTDPPEPQTLPKATRRDIASSSRRMTPNTKRSHRTNGHHTTYRRAGVGATEYFKSFEG
jgi:hypothetical protein